MARAGHHLQYQLEARGLDGLRGVGHVLSRVPPARKCEHPVGHALRAQLYGLHAAAAQPAEHLAVYRVRPGGQAYGRYVAALQVRLSRAQQRLLLTDGNGGEGTAVKRQLAAPLRLRERFCALDRRADVLWRRAGDGTGDAPLIAEYAVVRAAQVRYKDRDDALSRAHLPFSSLSAACAAACSASFLVRPEPEPMGLPLRLTWLVKVLSWSGPLSPSSS